MAALKFSYSCTAILLSTCASASSTGSINIRNTINGCMKISDYSLLQKNDPVILSVKLEAASPDKDCPCKSSLVKYSVFQKIDEQTSPLLEGNFSILGMTKIELPIATQHRLIFKDTPVTVLFSCFGSS